MKEQRKLAAIMFTDIVGYSALMTKDEKVALQILGKNRELQKVSLRKYHGEFIKEIGDGTLSIFQSSWDAIRCAIELQNTLNEEAYFQLRIGIHIGDIVISEKDVFGDGVNVASRIQALCEPGGILISEKVYDDIRNKPGIKVDCLGEKMLKNIDEPVKIYAISAECFKRVSEQHSAKDIQPKQGKGWLRTGLGVLTPNRTIGIAAVIILAIIITGGYFIFCKKQGTSPFDKEGSALKDNRQVWTNSIAVLPFTNLSPEKDQEYFCDGMVEELINVLSHIPELKVVARTSAFSFKGKEVDIRDIGEKLNVRNILEGSVRKSGNQLRISAQLIDVSDGYHLWSNTYDRELKDVFVIQDEISLAIVDALKTKLLPGDKIEKQQTENTEAYQLYLKGRFFWNKRTATDLQKAIGYFSQAIEKDPEYAMAYTGLASTYVLLPEYAALSSSESYRKADSAAKKALELDPALAEPHSVLGIIKQDYEWDWTGAEIEYKKAIEINPNYPTAHHWYTIYLYLLGRSDEALSEINRALELDPLSPIINVNLGDVLFFMRQYDKAIDQYHKTLELDPDFAPAHLPLGYIYTLHGKFDEAITEFKKMRTIVGNNPYGLSLLGFAYARSGDKDNALKALHDLFDFMEQGYTVAFDIAIIYYGLGYRDHMFEWFEKSYQERDFRLTRMKIEPIYDDLRSDSRTIALLRKMGLGK
ncbi:MAG TPA: adenylate/guanylate cyclase domain-containing protein [Bacteroidales bacterium]|nr:adenylate/guanylate cyclase domain-containing protein [Bacteroidales bacterium]HNS46057.1 adenylate/guanylate cyclase domain-containing protein [Bacteroidales bacterium]